MNAKSRGLCFTSSSVLAIMNTAPEQWPPEPINRDAACKGQTMRVIRGAWFCDAHWTRSESGAWQQHVPYEPLQIGRCPYGSVGDYLYVRETWRVTGFGLNADWREWRSLLYEADNANPPCMWVPASHRDLPSAEPRKGWRSGRFMPRWAARTWLRLSADPVPVRVQNITNREAIWEGIERSCTRPDSGCSCDRNAFARLWDGINAKRSYGWDANPWVWRLRFVVCGKPEDNR